MAAWMGSRIYRALLKSTYGPRYARASEAHQLAREIKWARHVWPRLRPLLQKSKAPTSNREISNLCNRMDQLAQRLLTIAMRSAKELRIIADVLDGKEMQDPRQANIIAAYWDCLTLTGHPPTLAELRKVFVAGFGKRCWPTTDFSVRKTLQSLGLPLAKAKRGRPHGSRSQIGNLRRVKQ
jgi:hypothetical protein